MRKKSATTEDQHEAALETLRRAFERRRPDYRPVEGDTRVTLVNSLNHLAKLAGIERGERTRAELYEEAARILTPQGKPNAEAVEYVQFLCATVRQEWARRPRSPHYVNRLKQHWYDIATTLGRAISSTSWEEYEVTTNEERDDIVREITALAGEAGVEHEDEPNIENKGFLYEQTYIKVLKNLGGTDNGSPHGTRLKELATEIGERARAAREKERAARATSTPTRKSIIIAAPAGPQRLYTFTITSDDYHNLGLIPGEVIDVYPADDLKPGDAGAVADKDGEHAYLGRVVSVNAEQITLRDDKEETTYIRADVESVGRADIYKVRKADPLSKAEREKVLAARAAIEKLSREDDQIIRCTERYRLEKLIYDIEHPANGDPDDWSDWEDE